MRRHRLAAILVALLVGVGLGWFLRRPPAGENVGLSPQPPAIGLREAGIVLRHKGTKQAEVHAARAEVSRDLRYARFVGLANAVFYDNGAIALRFRTQEIIFDRRTNDLIVPGPLEITSPRGDRLLASEARWQHARGRLIFSKGVRMRVGDNEVQASRLVVDAGLRTFDLDGGVDIVFPLTGASP